MQLELFPTLVYTRYELSFMISPILRIKNYVKMKKKLTGAMIGKFKSLRYPAHVSLGKLLIRSDQVDKSLRHAKESLKDKYAFTVYFEDFDIFLESKTIFVKIANPESIISIFESLFIGEPPTPHMTIAEGLSDDQFYHAWNYFQNKEYKDHFLCDHILVLRKEEGSSEPWEQYERIPLTSF